MKNNYITVIGAGLAGCEAANIITSFGVPVKLIEQKPKKFSPAHHSEYFAELVCSNSLKAERLNSAAGLLKTEMEMLGSLLVPIAKTVKVPAGGALAVDRDLFMKKVTEKIKSNPLIQIEYREATEIESGEDNITVVATGPLTEGAFAESLKLLTGDMLYFYDAAAPIVDIETVDKETSFMASRYTEGEGDYINCPMNKEEYERFYNELINAEIALVHEFDKIYEGCVPIEVLAKKGKDTMRFGPLKPVGLINPATGHRPYANLQLRKETANGNMYNLVGFQTNLKFGEQQRVFSLIPALKNAEFCRFGVMHRNSFINAPKVINADFSLKANNNVFLAGQISGVEGYMESAAAGIMAGINAVKKLKGEKPLILSEYTMIGGLTKYITTENKHFQPMGAAFGLLPPLEQTIRDKKERYAALAERSLKYLQESRENNDRCS